MNGTLIPLGSFTATNKMVDLVTRVLRSERLSYGEVSSTLEHRFAFRHDCSHGVLSNSGTSSLQVAIQALALLHGWQEGDEVIVPAVTFVASVNAVLHNRLTPVLVDVDPHHYDLDPALAEAAITPRTRAILAVNLCGAPCALDSLRALADANHLMLVEDSCEALGVNYRGKSVGAWGDVGIFSFYMAHIICAGVGGIAITNDETLALKMRSLVNHGITLDGLPSGTRYDPAWLGRNFTFEEAGHSFRITELEAAIAMTQMDDLHDIVARRQEAADQWARALDDLQDEIQLPVVRPGAESSWMMYPLVLHNHRKYDFMRHLRLNGIECRELLPLISQPYLHDLVGDQTFPVAERLNYHGLYVGCTQETLPYQVRQASEVMRAFFQKGDAHAIKPVMREV